jgi:hypothetical protein
LLNRPDPNPKPTLSSHSTWCHKASTACTDVSRASPGCAKVTRLAAATDSRKPPWCGELFAEAVARCSGACCAQVRTRPLSPVATPTRHTGTLTAVDGDSEWRAAASPPHRPREYGLNHPADTSRSNLAAALGLLSRRRLSKHWLRCPAPVESSRASPPHKPREDGLNHPANTSRSNLAAALGLVSRWRLSKPQHGLAFATTGFDPLRQ